MKFLPFVKLAVVLALALGSISCGSKVSGTYSNENGLAVLDVKSGSKAVFTIMGETSECTYDIDDDKLVLDCGKGDKMSFNINSDGSLTGPGFIGSLRKKG